MASVELGTGYLTLAAETSQLAKQVGGIFKGAETQASRTGQSMGKAIAKGFDQNKPDIDTLTADVERAEKRVAAQAEVSGRKVEAAKRKTEIAQAKLNETTAKYGPKSSQALTAVDRLATAEQKLEAETLSAADAQNRLQTELKQSKDALSSASKQSETASKTYVKGWRGVGQRIKDQLSGGMKSAMTKARTDAVNGGKRAGGGFSGAFKGAIGGLAAGLSLGAAVTGIKEVTQAAGDAEQSIGAIDTVFKENAQTMHDWAATASQTVGISGNEYRELGTLLGSQLKNMGTPMDQIADKTNGLIGMGADMASMFGGTTKEAIEAISSALKGEMDPIEKYGVTLSAAALDAEALATGIIKPVKDADKIAAATTKLELAQNKYNAAVKKNGKDSDEAKRAKLALTSAEAALDKATAGKIPKLDKESKALAIQSALYGQSADAQGNFARESDTLQNKQQKTRASFEDLKVTLGNAFLPAMADAFGFLNSTAIPALQKFAGWIKENQAWLKPLAVTVAATAGAFWAFSGVASIIFGITKAVAAFKLGFAALNVVMKANVFVLIASLIAGLVAGFIYLWKTNEDFRNFFIGMWNGIASFFKGIWDSTLKPVIGWIASAFSGMMTGIKGYWNSTLKPVFTAIGSVFKTVWETVVKVALTALVAYFSVQFYILKTLWTTVLKPVFSAIGSFFKSMWNNTLKPAMNAVTGFFKNTFAPGISNVWNNKLKPVFKAVGDFFKSVWNNVLKPAFKAVKDYFANNLAPGIGNIWRDKLKPVFNAIGTVFKWVWDYVLNPTFKHIKRGFQTLYNGIKSIWTDKLKPIFNTLGTFVRDTVHPIFKKGVDKIKSTWETIKEFAKKPIKFVIDTVINNGLIEAFNKVAGWVPGVAKLDKISIPGFARGGYTGAGSKYQEAGIVHADEFVIRKESQRSIERSAPGLMDKMNRFGAKALGYASGGLVRPLRGGRVSSGFGANRGGRPHAGQDFATPVGTPIFASMDGVVSKAGWNAIAGRTGIGAFLGHDGNRNTYYGHLSRLLVKVGDTVKAGQQIALSGNTGRSTGPHLHFETWTGGKPVNPAPYLGGALLPEGGSGGGFGNPLQPLLDFGGKIKSMITDKFPGGGMLTDIAKAVPTKLYDGVKGWLSEKAAQVGDVGQDVWGNTKNFFNGFDSETQKKVRAVAANYGWNSGRHWDSLNQLINKESSWNPNAQNPNSTAYGLFQFLNSTWRGYGGKTSDPTGQAVAGLKYIQDRYGDPERAWKFHKSNGWYANGGLVTPTLYDGGGWLHNTGGPQLVEHRKSKPDAVLSNAQWDSVMKSIEVSQTIAGVGTGTTVYNIQTPQGATVDDLTAALRFEKRKQNRGGVRSAI